jgi:hypothetical protein
MACLNGARMALSRTARTRLRQQRRSPGIAPLDCGIRARVARRAMFCGAGVHHIRHAGESRSMRLHAGRPRRQRLGRGPRLSRREGCVSGRWFETGADSRRCRRDGTDARSLGPDAATPDVHHAFASISARQRVEPGAALVDHRERGGARRLDHRRRLRQRAAPQRSAVAVDPGARGRHAGDLPRHLQQDDVSGAADGLYGRAGAPRRRYRRGAQRNCAARARG